MTGAEPLKRAISAIGRGYYVFPVKVEIADDGQKDVRPVGKWREASTQDLEQVEKWWSPGSQWATAWVGIDCGKSGVVVIDCDPPDGISNWTALGVGPYPFASVTTPRGGRHYYFRADSSRRVGIDNSGKVAPNVDVRGDGGFAFCYGWAAKPGDLPPVPEIVHDRMGEKAAEPASASGAEPAADEIDVFTDAPGRMFTKSEAREFVERNGLAALRAARVGTINGKCNTAAAVLSHFVPNFWTADEAYGLLCEALKSTAYDGKTWRASRFKRIIDGRERVADPWIAYVTPEIDGEPVSTLTDHAQTDAPGEGGKSGRDGESGSAPIGLNLPDDFWQARDALSRVRQAAHSRCDPADVTLFSLLARLAAITPHHVRIDSGIKGKASPALFAAIAGPSGTGKSTGVDGAEMLLPMPPGMDCPVLPIGSGEGLAEAYMGVVEEEREGPNGKPKTVKIRQQVRHNALFVVDEGATVRGLLERSGSVLGETLRSAFSGQALGQANAGIETRRVIPSGSYSIGLTMGVQVGTSDVLLSPEAVDSGLAQRFLWCWAADPSIPDDAPEWPGELGSIRSAWLPGTITFCPALKERIRTDQLARVRGEAQLAPLDSHKPLTLVKVSALLAVLDLRAEVTEADWTLAEVLWATSCRVRDHLLGKHRAEAEAKIRARADLAVETAARSAVASAGALESATAVRVARVLARAVSRAGGDGLTHGGARKALQGKDRPSFESGLGHAIETGWIADDGQRLTVGKSRPA